MAKKETINEEQKRFFKKTLIKKGFTVEDKDGVIEAKKNSQKFKVKSKAFAPK